MTRIRIGIYGYGNIGRGAELAVLNSPDMELAGIFTRRDNVKTEEGYAINVKDILKYKDDIDILLLCGGSATDLPVQGAEMLQYFNTVDSFDTHAKIPEYYDKLNKVGKDSKHLGLISVGWDPGLLSMARMLFQSVLPNGNDYTFWGKGVSQGHSDAIRRIEGVADARQYTIPVKSAVDKVRNGESPEFTTRDKHLRECYVVADDGADKARIEKEIVTMPNYFADYDTTVHFITHDEMNKNHSGLPHAGSVIRSGNTYSENKHVMEFSIKLDSNSEFTSSVMVAYARAVHRMYKSGNTGCITVFDVPLSLISPMSPEELRAELL